MLLSSILALALAAPQGGLPVGTLPSMGNPASGPNRVQEPLGSTPRSLGGTQSSPFAPPMAAAALPGRMLELTLNLPGHTWEERLILAVPHGLQQRAPLLVLFHGYGEDPQDVLQNAEELVRGALQRGWIVHIPLGAHEYNYGIDYAQENIEETLGIICSRLPVDHERIYAVGFSMGGGAAASFAARHLDPDAPRIAAVVNHTGSTSLRSTYVTSNIAPLMSSPLMFGDTPDGAPFRYQRSSTVDHDPLLGQLHGDGQHMALNLGRTPLRSVWATYDLNVGLVEQTLALDDFSERHGTPTSEDEVSASIHTWTTLDATETLDWLGARRLWSPVPGDIVRTLADRSGKWHDLELELRDPGAFAPLLWSAQPAQDTLYLIGHENLERLSTDIDAHGIAPSRPFKIMTQSLDGDAPEIVLEGVDAPPFAVQYRGAGHGDWTHDAATRTLTLTETGQASWAQWIVQR